MENYKGYYGTRTEYIEHLKNCVKFWARAFAEEPGKRVAMQTRLENAENALAAEGVDWDEIETLEIEGMKGA
jgi:hypothetical protein